MTKNVNWISRKELFRKYLVGTKPFEEHTFDCVAQFKELEAAQKLGRGPIDLQYASYKKSLSKLSGNIRVRKGGKNLLQKAEAAAVHFGK